jgi:hypothetical protein
MGPTSIRLHLGCGERYLEGYVNIDYPPEQHSVQLSSPADVYADIAQLRYEPATVTEIRLHHVFEHFDRTTALRMLIDWYEWLEEDGVLIIETPDFEASARRFIRKRFRSDRNKVVRHVFGSQEAPWAFHADGWYEQKYRLVLEALGYDVSRVKRSSWRGTDNITVTARKPAPPWLSREAMIERAREILTKSMVDDSPSERRLHEVWAASLSGHAD